MQIVIATMKNSVEFPQIIKNKTTLWPSNSTSGYISKGIQNTYFKRYMYSYFHCSIIYNKQDMEASQVLMDMDNSVMIVGERGE